MFIVTFYWFPYWPINFLSFFFSLFHLQFQLLWDCFVCFLLISYLQPKYRIFIRKQSFGLLNNRILERRLFSARHPRKGYFYEVGWKSKKISFFLIGNPDLKSAVKSWSSIRLKAFIHSLLFRIYVQLSNHRLWQTCLVNCVMKMKHKLQDKTAEILNKLTRDYGPCRRKWIRWSEFKSSTRLFVFHFTLMPLKNLMATTIV